VFPPVLAYLNLALFRPSVTFGFSGVAMAFVGYLPFALADYLDELFDIGPANQVGPMLFLLSLICIAALSVQSVPPTNRLVVFITILSILLAALSALSYARSLKQTKGGFRTNLHTVIRTPGHCELTTIAIMMTFAIQFVAYPLDPSSGRSVLNLYVHFLGYALGFLAIFTTVETAERLGWRDPTR